MEMKVSPDGLVVSIKAENADEANALVLLGCAAPKLMDFGIPDDEGDYKVDLRFSLGRSLFDVGKSLDIKNLDMLWGDKE